MEQEPAHHPPNAARDDGMTEVVIPTSSLRQVDAMSDHGEKLATLLESHCMSMRRNVMDFYREARSSFLQSQNQAVSSERRACSTQLQSKQTELERRNADLEAAQSRNSELEGFLLSSCGLNADLNQRIRLRRLLATQFKDWRAVVAWRKHERSLEKKADHWCAHNTNFFRGGFGASSVLAGLIGLAGFAETLVRGQMFRYTVETLQRRVLKRWWFNASVHMKVQARKGLGLVKGLQDQIAQQQADMNSLQMQLVETRRALVAEKQGRDMLTQDMKRSFMRGVCALNLEAMQVMKRGVVPGAPQSVQSIGMEQNASDDGDADCAPNPRENLPANIQNMMSSLNMTAGPGMAPQPLKVPTMKQGNPMAGLAVKEK